MATDLEAKAVLLHLNKLGYHNIGKEQLEEFIQDLKKLIKHDAAKLEHKHTTDSENVNSSEPRGVSSHCPVVMNQICSTSSQTGTHSHGITSAGNKKVSSKAIYKRRTTLCMRDVNSAATSDLTSSSTVSASRSTSQAERSKQHAVATSVHSKSSTTFIRPWQLASTPSVSKLAGHRDPVSLYHHYQEMWKQQKMPGEDHHKDLRWSIRQRMLGETVNPKPVSRTSSMEHMHLRHKR